jgi:hypothetical protein
MHCFRVGKPFHHCEHGDPEGQSERSKCQESSRDLSLPGGRHVEKGPTKESKSKEWEQCKEYSSDYIGLARANIAESDPVIMKQKSMDN